MDVLVLETAPKAYSLQGRELVDKQNIKNEHLKWGHFLKFWKEE
jgi:hypothetical protein